MLIGCRWHLHGYDVASLDTLDRIEAVWMIALEFGHDQRLADVRVAVQHHAGHAFLRRRFKQVLQLQEGLAGPGVVDPAIAPQRLDTGWVVQGGLYPTRRLQVGKDGSGHGRSQTSTSKGFSVLP